MGKHGRLVLHKQVANIICPADICGYHKQKFALVCLQAGVSSRQSDTGQIQDDPTGEKARIAAELAEAKRKFMAVAKRKQQEHNKKVCLQLDVLTACCLHLH